MAEIKMFSYKGRQFRAKLQDGEIPSCEIWQLQELPGGGAMMSEPVYIGFGGYEDDDIENIDDHITEFKKGRKISAVSKQGFDDWDRYDHDRQIAELKASGKWKPDKQVEADGAEEIETAMAAQRNLCIKQGLPLFVPHDGKCFKCHRNVFLAYPDDEVKADPEKLVTGCPHCGQTFCD